MKKIILTSFLLSMVVAMHASFHLTLEKWVEEELVETVISTDTTIVVTDYEYDEDMDEATMGIEGKMYSDESENITVTITRSATGIFDQFCAGGQCINGNKELTQELVFEVADETKRRWFTHYNPIAAGKETIVYAFNDGVNPTVTLSVEYNYSNTAVDNVDVRPVDNTIYNLLGQRMPTCDLSELPAGIYIINGKKYSKH